MTPSMTLSTIKDWLIRLRRRFTNLRSVKSLRIRHFGEGIRYEITNTVSSLCTSARVPVENNATGTCPVRELAPEYTPVVPVPYDRCIRYYRSRLAPSLVRLKHTNSTDWFVYTLRLNQKMRDLAYRIGKDKDAG